jgi:predicted small lipoprotein YifL
MNLKKLFYFFLISLLTLTSCGKKGALEHLKDEKRPKFDKVIDEEN